MSKGKKNSNGYAQSRRKVALANLNKQLADIEESNSTAKEPIDLSKDRNYQRIKKEISNIEKNLKK